MLPRMKPSNDPDRIMQLAAKRGLLRTRDISGISANPRVALSRLVADGSLQKVSRGVYALPDRTRSSNHQYAEVATRYPQATLCLLSALRFHQLTTQNPHEIWLAIPNKARTPQLDYPPLRVVRFSGLALTEGIESHKIDGVSVRVYSVPKTVADCFKFRNKIGLDVALEALRECRRAKRATNDEIWRYAQICRVANVMRPYLDSVE
jgi:predicted transcriptional regulator of viral defense system